MIKPLSRRTMLRGLGTCLALPMLEVMMPRALRAQEVSPLRMLFYYVPNGMNMDDWRVAGEGRDFTLSTILSPLAGFEQDMLVLSGLDMYPATDQGDGGGDHARGTGAFLTSRHVNKSDSEVINGVSVDQVLAQSLGHQTTFRSLELGGEPGPSTGSCDSGYSCAYSSNIAWSSASTPVAKETDPQMAFDRLFSGGSQDESAEQRARRILYKQSILDFVREDAARLQARLGASDRARMDEYLTGIRELEQRLYASSVLPCDPGVVPEESDDYFVRIRQLADIAVLALQCDRTRFVTYMLDNAQSQRIYPQLGIYQAHHYLSHHDGNADKLAKLSVIDTWEVGELAYLIQRLSDVTEPDGSRLLDQTLVYFSSEIADGNAHGHSDMPVLLLGRAGGRVTPGRHLVYQPHRPMADLFLAMLEMAGVYLPSFGDDGVEPLTGLLE